MAKQFNLPWVLYPSYQTHHKIHREMSAKMLTASEFSSCNNNQCAALRSMRCAPPAHRRLRLAPHPRRNRAATAPQPRHNRAATAAAIAKRPAQPPENMEPMEQKKIHEREGFVELSIPYYAKY